MIYKIITKDKDSITIPKVIIDNFIKLASGDQLKVLLFISVHQEASLNVQSIAFNTALSEETVSEAIDFWKKINVLAEYADDAALVSNTCANNVFKSTDEFIDCIKRKLNITYNLSDKECKVISEWFWNGLSLELILYAYADAILRINKSNINYINKILASWIEENKFTIADVAKFESKDKKTKKSEILAESLKR